MPVSEMVMINVVISRWDFFYRSLCMLHDTRKKAEHLVTLQPRLPPLCTKLLFVVNTLTVFLSFCYIECELFAEFTKILFDNWRHFCVLLSFMCLWKVPRVGAFDHLNGPFVGHLNGILARVGGIWTIIFKKVKCPGGCPGGRGGCWSVNLTDTLRVYAVTLMYLL